VTPSLGGYSFTPASRNHSNVTGALTGQDYAATAGGGPAAVFYIHADHLNTPRVITNQAQAAQVVWRWDHAEPFGSNPPNENPSGLGTFTCNLRLPGQYFDKETNLHYNYFRDYDPAIGRYIQADPLGVLPGTGMTPLPNMLPRESQGVLDSRQVARRGVNQPYAYVKGNPISRVDPTGLLDFNVCVGSCLVTFVPLCAMPGFAQAACAVCLLLPPPADVGCLGFCLSTPIVNCIGGITAGCIAGCGTACFLLN